MHENGPTHRDVEMASVGGYDELKVQMKFTE